MLIYFKTIIGILLGEQAIKHFISEKEKTGKKSWILPKGIEIRRLENEGAATGIFSEQKEYLKIVSSIVLLFCGLFLWKEKKQRSISVSGMGLALIFGGGLSNLFDRFQKGSVTDYVCFKKFPLKSIRHLVFNVADFCIFIGGLLLFLGEKIERKQQNEKINF